MSASMPERSGPAMFPRLMLLCITLMVVPTPYFRPSIASIALIAGVMRALPSEKMSRDVMRCQNVVDNGNPAIPKALSMPPSTIRLFLSYLSASTPQGRCNAAFDSCPKEITVPAIVTERPSPPSAIVVDMYIVRNPKIAPLPMLLTVLKTKLARSIRLISIFLKLGLAFSLPVPLVGGVSGRNTSIKSRLMAVPAHIT